MKRKMKENEEENKGKSVFLCIFKRFVETGFIYKFV